MKFVDAVESLVQDGADGDYIDAGCFSDGLVRITKEGDALLVKGSKFLLKRMPELTYDVRVTKKTLTFHEALEAVLLEGKTVRATAWGEGYELRPNKYSGMTLYCGYSKSQAGITLRDKGYRYEVVK